MHNAGEPAPRSSDAWHALAAGRVLEARNGFSAIVVRTPHHADAWLGLTLALWQTGDRFATLGAARKALAADPAAADPALILGAIQRQIGDVTGACATLETARTRHPANADVLRLLADVYRRARRSKDALETAQRALTVDASSTRSLVCLGDALVANERYEGAENAYRVALALDEGDVGAALGLARVALLRADWHGAQAAFERAHAIAPHDADARYNLALSHLRFGRFAEGFAAYPAIVDTASDEARYYYYHEGVPLWDGTPLRGRRLVISSDQGLGDHLMMARFFANLPREEANIVIETPAPLLSLFARNFPHLHFDRFTHWQPAYTMDVHLPITQLPRFAHIHTAADIPTTPYLRADPKRVETWRTRLNTNPNVHRDAAPRIRNVGIVWHGNPINTRERWRAAPLANWAPLAAIPGIQLHALQFEATEAEIAAAPFPLLPTHQAIADFDDLAAAMTALDAIVTVDTAAVHLAGALARPTYLANPLISDYRWAIDTTTTPWYPSVQIIRQTTSDEWPPVFQTIATALHPA